MRELTFKGYLQQQLSVLSDCNSKSLYKFARLAEHNARLRDVLCLYLHFYVPDKLSSQLMKRFAYLKHLSATMPEQLTHSQSEYKTIYENYLNQKNAKKNEDKIKSVMHKRIVKLQAEKGISNYRIYKALDLNPGNVNAFLKYGDVSKVGLNTACEILGFVNQYGDNFVLKHDISELENLKIINTLFVNANFIILTCARFNAGAFALSGFLADYILDKISVEIYNNHEESLRWFLFFVI